MCCPSPVRFRSPSPQYAPPLPGAVSGKWVDRYGIRWVDYSSTTFDRGERRDQDLWSYLSVRAKEVSVDGLSAVFAARYTQDVDGRRRASVFTDTIDENFEYEAFRAYRAYAQYARPTYTVRLGRQGGARWRSRLPAWPNWHEP